jgi:plastocyanin
MTKARAVFVCAVAAALMTVSSTAISQPARSAGSVPTLGKVKIIDFAFQPATITVPRGSLVGWKNFGAVSHTSTSNSGIWNLGPIAPGSTVGRYFRRAGTYPYHCTIHPTMTGSVVVT